MLPKVFYYNNQDKGWLRKLCERGSFDWWAGVQQGEICKYLGQAGKKGVPNDLKPAQPSQIQRQIAGSKAKKYWANQEK